MSTPERDVTESGAVKGRGAVVTSWPGVLDTSLLKDSAVTAGHRLADAAKAGEWATVIAMVDDDDQFADVNQWRPDGGSWFTTLHQVGWHGAPVAIASALIERGALRSLRDAKGRTALDVTMQRGHRGGLVELLTPPPSPLKPERILALDAHLGAVIDARIREEGIDQSYSGRDLRKTLRYPPVEVLHEAPGQHMWFDIPGMYGGFRITLRQGYLDAVSWIRVVEGSGQAHVITHEKAILVDQGFV